MHVKSTLIHFLISAIISTLCLSTTAQVNLVPNPSFEDTVFCPWGSTQLEACSLWQNFGNTPDYFNACSPIVNVPNASFGFQYAHSGVGMAGMIIYNRPTAPAGPNYREPIGVELTHPLQINEKYYFSFYTNYSNTRNVSIAASHIGLKFSTVAFDSCCPAPTNNFAHLFSPICITDSTNWTKLSGSFFADSAYRYVMIGNFFDDTITDTMLNSQFPSHAYYYVDDVCVTTDSIYNMVWTSAYAITQQNEAVNLYITSQAIKLDSKNNPILSVIIFNSIGQLLFQDMKINSYEYSLPIDILKKSVHFIHINTSNSNITKKIMIVH